MTNVSRTPRGRSLSVRELHAYIGMLVAPMVLFLTFTGLLQVYNLHEAHGSYTPAPIIVKMSSVHKDQVFRAGHDGPPPGAAPQAAPGGPPEEHHHKQKLSVTLLKAYFALVAIALFCSTCFGIWIALKSPLRRRTHLVLLVIGIIIPVALAALSAG